MKHILAVSGSLREGSSNDIILKFLQQLAPEGYQVDFYHGLRDIPAFDPGLDNDTPPESVVQLRNQLQQADGVIICTPEYAFGIPGALKNSLDWIVSSGSFVEKPTALITASTGGENAHAALLKVLGAINAHMIADATLLISFVRSKISSDGTITDADTVAQLQALFKAFIAAL